MYRKILEKIAKKIKKTYPACVMQEEGTRKGSYAQDTCDTALLHCIEKAGIQEEEYKVVLRDFGVCYEFPLLEIWVDLEGDDKNPYFTVHVEEISGIYPCWGCQTHGCPPSAAGKQLTCQNCGEKYRPIGWYCECCKKYYPISLLKNAKALALKCCS